MNVFWGAPAAAWYGGRISELMEALSTADPDAMVLFLAFGADLDEAVKTSAVCVDKRPWTHEEGRLWKGSLRCVLPRRSRRP
jgi:hypothetical protein